MRNPTAEELKWWASFKRCMKSMPKSVEVIVSAYGSCSLTEAGSERAFFNANGHTDNVPTFTTISVIQKRLITNEGSI